MTRTTWRNVLRSLVAVNEGPGRWHVGLEAGLATAVPLGLLTFFGYQSLGLIASLGSFTALFFGRLPRLERAKGQSLVGAVFVASVVSVPLGIPRGYWVVLTAVAIL